MWPAYLIQNARIVNEAGQRFHSRITPAWMNGHPPYGQGRFVETMKGQRLTFHR